jgi:hypothetical protein
VEIRAEPEGEEQSGIRPSLLGPAMHFSQANQIFKAFREAELLSGFSSGSFAKRRMWESRPGFAVYST